MLFTSQGKGLVDEYQNYEDVQMSDLKALLLQFVGETATAKLFHEHAERKASGADAKLVKQAQQALSGVVGVASSQAMIDSLGSGHKLAVEEVVSMFEETTRVLRFNQDILFASFENISSGISVVNGDLNMVAWNRRYEEMFNYPKGMLQIGTPVADLVRLNAKRGLLGPGAIEEHVQRRLTHLLNGKPYRVVRNHHNHHVIEIKGNPLPDGGYVTTYDDITEFIETQNELERSNVHLERRVERRTQEIQSINEDLRKEIDYRKQIEQQLLKAKSEAESANATKSRFLALASHDILQPINAANLYASALLDTEDDRRDMSVVRQIRDAILSAEGIIASLLEIARLDTGSLEPRISVFPVNEVLGPLINEFQVQLNPGVVMRYVPSRLVIASDRNYLRRILQNFLSNAVKYTAQGKILLGCRRRQGGLKICVFDTGQGISEPDLDKVFSDFYRAPSQKSVTGLGLGLAVAGRLAELLEHPIEVQSRLQQGSQFSLSVPLSHLPQEPEADQKPERLSEIADLQIVYVDDEQANLDATATLLSKWGCVMQGVRRAEQALLLSQTQTPPDVLLMDYQLDEPEHNGFELAQAMLAEWQCGVPVCIISAAAEADLNVRAREQGYDFLSKPVKPARLRALLGQLALRAGKKSQDNTQNKRGNQFRTG